MMRKTRKPFRLPRRRIEKAAHKANQAIASRRRFDRETRLRNGEEKSK